MTWSQHQKGGGYWTASLSHWALPVKKFGSFGSICLSLGRQMTDRTACPLCLFPFQTEGRGTGCDPLRISELWAGGCTSLNIKAQQQLAFGFPQTCGTGSERKKECLHSVSSPSCCHTRPGYFSVRDHVDSLGAERLPVSCRAERAQWFLFHEQRCKDCGVEATDIKKLSVKPEVKVR